MPNAIDQSPPDPVLRFRTRTMIAVTSVLAVLAAIAAPYCRAQAPPVRTALLIYWSFVLAFSSAAAWRRCRERWKLDDKAGPISIVLWVARPTRSQWFSHPIFLAAAIAMLLLHVASQSAAIAHASQRIGTMGLLSRASFGGAFHGFIFGGFLFVYLRRPVYLCRDGLSGECGFIPWRYIRRAEWLVGRGDRLKLRRYDGDLYLDVPNNLRTDVEAFVRGKTLFVGDAASTPV